MENLTFEALLKELEQIVKDLENKEIELDVAVQKYQKGLELAKACNQKLMDADQLIFKELKS